MKILLKMFRKKSKEFLAPKYYTFKTIPLVNWKACQEGNIIAVRKGIDIESDIELTEKDLEVWEEFQDQYINEFNENTRKILHEYSLRIRITNLKISYLQDSVKNRILLNDIRQLEEELTKMRDSEGDGMSLDECHIVVSKFQGYHIPETITAYQFFTIIKTINKHGKDN